jgi:sugar O-acyltransferase (sialic acid O-acetyltransferase NeuD family)
MRLLVIGAGAQARYILNNNQQNSKYGKEKIEIVGLIDTANNPSIWGKEINGYRVLGNLSTLDNYLPDENLRVISAISNLKTKREVVTHLESRGYSFYNMIHPSVIFASDSTIGEDVIINAGVTIEPGTAIHNHVIIHAGCIIEHDNILEDFVNLAPGVTTAGRVHIKSGAIIYTGVVIIPDIVIGDNAIVGAGSVVIKSVEPGTKVAGVPARRIDLVSQ